MLGVIGSVRRRSTLVAAVGVLCAIGTAARADSLSSLYGTEITETRHAVRITLDRGAASFRVRRTLENVGVLDDQAELDIDLPSGGVVTGLRVRGAGGWRSAALLPADEAERRYQDLTDVTRLGFGELTEHAPALLAWTGTGAVSLRVFPVRGGGTADIEYTVTVPTCYAEGALLLDYPDVSGANLARPAIVVAGARAKIYAANAAGAPGVRASFEDRCGNGTHDAGAGTVIAVEPGAIDRAAIRYSTFRAGAGKVLARLEVDAAAVLEPLPVRARVVFVIDGSWSADDAGLADQLALAGGYLAHVPDAEVEVVVFRRRAERLFGGFTPAAEFARAVEASPASRRELGNGSNLDEGLALAANLLRSGERRPARIVVITDGRMRRGFEAARTVTALAGLPRHAVVHVVDRTRGTGAPYEMREDDHDLAPIAAAFGGMAVTIGGGADDPLLVAEVMLGLVRPIRIDGVQVHGAGLAETASLVPDVIVEGAGVRAMALDAAAPDRVRVTGKIWGRTFERVVARDRGFTRTLAALAFGHEVMDELTDDEQRGAAVLVGAVSPQTSYLASDDDRRPLVADPDAYAGLGLVGHGVSCCGGRASVSCCGGLHGRRARVRERPAFESMLAAWLRGPALLCARAHGLDDIAVGVTVETTGDEVVDVAVDGAPDDTVAACVADAAWELRLTREFAAEDRGMFRAHVVASRTIGRD